MTTDLNDLRLRLQVAHVTLEDLGALDPEIISKVKSAQEYIQGVIDNLAMLTDDSHG